MNLLNKDGVLLNHGLVIDSNAYYLNNLLKNIPWEHDELIMFGKMVRTKRQMALFGDQNISYKYSGVQKECLQWTEDLLKLKDIIEQTTEEKYNSCLLNLYMDGDEGMGFHSDNEPELKRNGSIASLSLGAERKFVLKHNLTKEKVEVQLKSGQLIEMKGVIQEFWKHSLSKSKKVKDPRINLTFRQINR